MNIHHLELFYYVARHGGIMGAVRNIPYGIQQPAVSGQVAQLEEFLGVTLFHRRPFELTPEGKKLFAFIEPFFSNLGKIAGELQGGQARQIRIGASAIVLRDHLPGVIQAVKRRHSGLNISLRDGYPAQFEAQLNAGEIDLAITLLEGKTRPGFNSVVLVELPMVLLVPRPSPLSSAEELWSRDRIDEPLICLPSSELVCRLFQQKLRELKVDWFTSIEASAVDLIESYVASGLGIGLTVSIPHRAVPPEIRALPLAGFPSIHIGALWRGKPSAVVQSFLDELKNRATQFTSPGRRRNG